MQEHESSEVIESNEQFIAAWKRFARGFPGAEVGDLPGLALAIAGVQMPMFNTIFLSSPARDIGDLVERAGTAIERGRRRGVGFLVSACDEWVGDLGAAREALAGLGLKLMMETTGMVTDELLPPRRPAPPGLEIRPIEDAAGREALSDLNCAAYGLALELGRASFAREMVWGSDVFGQLGFVDGQPVSSTAVYIVDNRLYVAFVATHADFRGRGYAEAVMRRALEVASEKTGLRRTVLHATEMGRPVYAAMGYRAVTRFTWYSPAS